MARSSTGQTVLIAGGAAVAAAGIVYLLMRKKDAVPAEKTLPTGYEQASWSPLATCDIMKSTQADIDAHRPGSQRVAIVPKSIAQTVFETLAQLDPSGNYSMQC
jgi:hypothetical protein